MSKQNIGHTRGGVKSSVRFGLREAFAVPDAGGVTDGVSILIIMANKYAALVGTAWPHRWSDGAKIRKVFEKAVKTV